MLCEAEHVLVCARCGRVFKRVVFRCPSCGGLTIFKYSDKSFSVDKSYPGIWRYRFQLPKISKTISRGEGLTPINKVMGVLVKNERFNPTGTYADRASSIISSYLLSSGIDRVRVRFEEDFTYSLAYYLDGALQVEILVDDPLSLDYSDIAVLSRTEGVSLSLESSSLGESYLSYVNPLTIEGLKTISFEIYERKVGVDRVVVPAKTGLLAFSIWKGFKDLEEIGLDIPYEVAAVFIKGSKNSFPLDLARYVKVYEIERDEVLRSLLKLCKKGFVIKPLSALAFTLSDILSNSLAIVTMGFRSLVRSNTRNTNVRREILQVLKSYGEVTAYEVWKKLPIYTLRGIYKVMSSMEERGEICVEIRSRGARKVKYYRMC